MEFSPAGDMREFDTTWANHVNNKAATERANYPVRRWANETVEACTMCDAPMAIGEGVGQRAASDWYGNAPIAWHTEYSHGYQCLTLEQILERMAANA